MTVRNLMKMLHDDGWIKEKQEGSHIKMGHPEKKGKVTVPNHKGDIKIKTLNSILKQAGLK